MTAQVPAALIAWRIGASKENTRSVATAPMPAQSGAQSRSVASSTRSRCSRPDDVTAPSASTQPRAARSRTATPHSSSVHPRVARAAASGNQPPPRRTLDHRPDARRRRIPKRSTTMRPKDTQMTSTRTVAIVTGAGRGMGRACADALVGTVATLVSVDRDERLHATACDELSARGRSLLRSSQM